MMDRQMLTRTRRGADKSHVQYSLGASAPPRAILLLLFVLCISVFGCSSSSGPKTAPVRGTVTMNGKPMPNIGVTFLPEGKGPSASGNTNENGEFSLRTVKPGDGAPIGKHHVVIGNAEEGPRKGPAIPEKYGRFETTDLTADVKAGEKNVVTLDLKP